MRADNDLELELHAYVDGDLDEDAMVRVEAYLWSNPDAAAKVRDYFRQKDDLRSTARQTFPLEESPTLTELGRDLAKRLRSGSGLSWRRLTAAAFLFLLGWLSHTFYAPLGQAPAFTNEVVQAHLLTSGDVSDIPPISPERVAKLFLRIGEIEQLPDLGKLGFEPVGAELVPSDEGAVLHVPYRDKDGTLISYFLLHDEKEEEVARHILHTSGITVVYWQHEHSRYALAAPLGDEDISRIAAVVDSRYAALRGTPHLEGPH